MSFLPTRLLEFTVNLTFASAASAALVAEIDSIDTALFPEPQSVDHLSILANRLRTAMDRCPTGRMSVTDLAAASGVSTTTIYQILRSERTCVNVETASRIETALGFRAGTIFGRADVTTNGTAPGWRSEPVSRSTHDHSGRQVVCPSCNLQVRRQANCMDCGESLNAV